MQILPKWMQKKFYQDVWLSAALPHVAVKLIVQLESNYSTFNHSTLYILIFCLIKRNMYQIYWLHNLTINSSIYTV